MRGAVFSRKKIKYMHQAVARDIMPMKGKIEVEGETYAKTNRAKIQIYQRRIVQDVLRNTSAFIEAAGFRAFGNPLGQHTRLPYNQRRHAAGGNRQEVLQAGYSYGCGQCKGKSRNPGARRGQLSRAGPVPLGKDVQLCAAEG